MMARTILLCSINPFACTMRTRFLSLGAALTAAFVLSSCNTEEAFVPTPDPSTEGTPFEISTILTKTTNDGLSTKWAADDAINLFHAEAGSTTYVSDSKFTVDEGLVGNFSGTLNGNLEEGKSYDWYAFYPYTEQIITPANTKGGYAYIGGRSDKAQTQDGNDSKEHLAGSNCPLYGVAKGVASADKPSLAMQQLASVVAVKVTNALDNDLIVSNVSFTSTEDITGQYYIDFAKETPDYNATTYVSKTANLTVADGTAITKGSSAVFYIAIKPHKVASGSTLTLSVNGANKTVTLTKDVTFTAGHIKTLAYNFDTEPEDYSGTYFILNKDKTKVCPAYTKGNNISAESYDATNEKDSWKMTIEKGSDTNMYTIKDANGLYLSTGATNGKNQLVGLSYADKDRSYWSITSSTDGSTYSIEASNSSYNKVMQYNSSANLFSCYASASQTDITLEKCLPRIVAPETVEAEVINHNSIYVLWDTVEGAKDYTVSCGDKSETVSGNDYTFTDLSYSTEYTISVVANPTDADNYHSSLPVSKTLNTQTPSGQYSATYTVTSTSEATKTGAAPIGSSVTFTSTSKNNKDQMTADNSQTYTLSGYEGKVIKKVVLSMKSNSKAGAGTFSLTAGEISLAAISSATTFDKWFDNTVYTQSYKNVTVELTNDSYQVQAGEKVVLVISATTNSLYCQSITITYE